MAYTFTDAEAATLPDVLSQPRFRTYMLAKNNVVEDALALYQWNAEVSSAMLYAIHIFEISIRNAAANAAASAYNPNWPFDRGFQLSLPDTRPPHFSPRKEIIAVRQRTDNITTGKIIADLKFAFWGSMYTSRHNGRLWIPYLKREYPYLPAGMTVSAARTRIYAVSEAVRQLRNRIAHHEPIFSRSLRADYDGIIEIVGYRSDQTANWLNRTQNVLTCLGNRP